jgi:hypothetical protein
LNAAREDFDDFHVAVDGVHPEFMPEGIAERHRSKAGRMARLKAMAGSKQLISA